MLVWILLALAIAIGDHADDRKLKKLRQNVVVFAQPSSPGIKNCDKMS